MSKRVLEIVIAGDAKGGQKALGAISTSAGKAGKAFKVLAIGAAAGFGAVAAGGFFAVKEASKFQDSMREVYTLLPEISGDAMKEMEGQVKDFSNEFGTLPNEVIPALYQAISAGVPQDNVFDFLEVAQQAAVGGVTDLTTAVDGISSVVNAYGSEILSASEASDLMFTAVRLGKTNFEELSASLFNVTPTAAALGIGFGDVTAGLASLTAAGVPTKIATTQMRAAFVELGKEGSKAFLAFDAASGQTFPEFIAAGGDLGDAVAIMGEHADNTGTSMLNMFGSVEGGSAFTTLGADLDGFRSNLDEMGSSAGATEAAFDTMNTGLSATMDRLKARFVTTAITVGEFLLPKIEAFSSWALNVGVPAVQAFIDKVTPLAEIIKDKAVTAFELLQEKIPPVVEVIEDKLVAAFETLVDFAEKSILPIIEAVQDAFAEDGLAGVFDLVKAKAIEFAPALAAIGTVAVVAFGAWAVSASAAAVSTLLAAAPLIAVTAAVAALAAGFVWAYQNVEWFRTGIDGLVGFIKDNWRPTFEAARDIVVTVFEKIWEVVEPLVGIFVDQIQLLKALFTGDFSRVWEEAKSIVSGAIGAMVAYFREFPLTVLSAFLGAAGGLLSGLGSWFTDTASPKVGEWLGSWTSAVVDWVAGIPAAIAGVVSGVWDGLLDAFKGVMNTIIRFWNGLDFTIGDGSYDPLGKFGPEVAVPSFTFGLPDISEFHAGGTVVFPAGQREGLIRVRDQERILTPGNAALQGGDVGSGDVVFKVGELEFGRVSKRALMAVIRAEGPMPAEFRVGA